MEIMDTTRKASWLMKEMMEISVNLHGWRNQVCTLLQVGGLLSKITVRFVSRVFIRVFSHMIRSPLRLMFQRMFLLTIFPIQRRRIYGVFLPKMLCHVLKFRAARFRVTILMSFQVYGSLLRLVL